MFNHIKNYSSKLNDGDLINKCSDFLSELKNLFNVITEEIPYEPQKEKRLIKQLKTLLIYQELKQTNLTMILSIKMIIYYQPFLFWVCIKI